TSGLLLQIGNLGLSSAAIYFVSRRPRRAGLMLTLAWSWSFFLVIIGLAASPLLGRLGLSRAAAGLISIWAGVQLALLHLDQVVLAPERFLQNAALQVGRKAGILILTAALVLTRTVSLTSLISAAILGDFLALITAAGALRRDGVHAHIPPLR